MCVCVYSSAKYTGVCACALVESQGQPQVYFFRRCLPCVVTGSLTGLEQPEWTGQLASEPDSAFPVPGSQVYTNTPCFLHRVLESNPGPCKASTLLMDPLSQGWGIRGAQVCQSMHVEVRGGPSLSTSLETEFCGHSVHRGPLSLSVSHSL